jgi:RNA polymerase sigma-B factor
MITSQTRTARRRAAPPRSAPASARREQMLFMRYQRCGDPAARRELVERFLPLARQLARRYRRGGDSEDLEQTASLGLLKAIDRFDPSRGMRFSSFAVPTILGEIKRHRRNTSWSAHVPRGMQERALRVTEAVDHLSGALGESPSPRVVADYLSLSVDEVLEAMEAAAAYDTVSLDAPARGGDEQATVLAESIGHDESRYDLVEYRVTMTRALRALPLRDRRILYLRFAEDLTQSEIAERTGLSQMHVSRLIRQALDSVRTSASGPEAPPDRSSL